MPDRRTAITNDQIETLNDPVNGDSLTFNTSEDIMEWKKNISQFPWTTLDCGFILTDSVITYYDSVGNTDITSGAVVEFNTVIANSDLFVFSVASGVITCNMSGTYFISYDVTINCTTSARSTAECFIELDTGSGFNTYTGSKAYTYNRNTTSGFSTATCTMLITLDEGDKVRVYTQRFSGSASLVTVADASRLSLFPKMTCEQNNHFGLDCGDIGDTTNITNTQVDCGGI